MLYEISDIKLLAIVSIFILSLLMVKLFKLNREVKISSMLFMSFFFLYSGLASAAVIMPITYLFYWVAFMTVFCISLILTKHTFRNLSERISKREELLKSFVYSKYSTVLFYVFLLSKFALLIHPNFNLDKLILPPSPDIRFKFDNVIPSSEFVSILKYIIMVCYPFYLLRLYKYRNSFFKILIIIAIPFYIDYILNHYIGRFDILFILTFAVGLYYYHNPKHRRIVLFSSIVSLPFLALFFIAYQSIRLGSDFELVSITGDITALILIESSYPIVFGWPAIVGGVTVEIKDFLVWIMTLPLPKSIFGLNLAADINASVSDFILGYGRDSSGWFIVLPGLLAESILVFGFMFPLYAVIIALLVNFYNRLLASSSILIPLYFVVFYQLSFGMNRAGFESLFPLLLNQFFVFNLFIAFVIVSSSNKKFN